METETLRYGVIGCAGMGTTHAAAVEGTADATLVACADVDEEIAREFATARDVAWYRDPVEMVVDADLDAVSVCTPNGTHADIVTALAETGVDILCEKPLDITPERVDRMIEACEREDVVLAGIFNRRTLGGPRLTREAVADGRLGDVVLADVQVKWHRTASYYEGWHGSTDLDGGILLTQALHGIDLLQWIVGDVERIAADLETCHHDVEAPDTAVASVVFENGARGQITASTAVYPQRPITVQVHGTEGTIEWRQGDEGLEAFETVDGLVDADTTAYDFDLGPEIEGQVRDFVRALLEGREPMVSPAEARKALDIVFAAQESVERGEWVDVDLEAVRGGR
ncbi:Gfo/Idh/MocA family protein [Halomontanus rarus]|uniref:Gfo/Idh/MocA family protein n=1 Tax=Halomontanus rarus TaxID=3034020 RepID=UPI001A99315C